MPSTLPDLADLIKLNDQSLSPRLASDLRQSAPFLMSLPADYASNGTVHNWLARTGAATVGFRAVNDGLAKAPSAQTKKTATLIYLDASSQSDVAYGEGFDSRVYGSGPMAYVQKEIEDVRGGVGYDDGDMMPRIVQHAGVSDNVAALYVRPQSAEYAVAGRGVSADGKSLAVGAVDAPEDHRGLEVSSS